MTGERYIKQAIIATLCEHPEREKYLTRAFSSANIEKVTEALSTQTHHLTKADFFAPDENGKVIIDTPGFWRNFEKILDRIHRSGDRFVYDDFMKPLDPKGGERKLLDSATENGGLAKVFTADVWGGRFDEMESLWYRVSMPARVTTAKTTGTLNLDLKRRMFEIEGRNMPEDRLAKSDLTSADVHDAFSERGKYEALVRKLEQNGDYLRKEYLLLRDKSGNTVFCHAAAWDKYSDISKKLAAHGEQMEFDDFVRRPGPALDILARASEFKALDKVFSADLWEDRLTEMNYLWSKMLPSRKTPPMTDRDFDLAYALAESKTYGKMLNKDSLLSKADLMGALNDISIVGAKPVIPLGLKMVWDDIEAVQKRLKDSGEVLTMADLRRPSGEMGNSCLINAVKFGHFGKVSAMVRAAGDKLTVDDFLSKDSHGATVLATLAERSELNLVFSADLWVGRLPDMKMLWSNVRHADRSTVNFAEVEVAVTQATLRQKANGGKFKFRK